MKRVFHIGLLLALVILVNLTLYVHSRVSPSLGSPQKVAKGSIVIEQVIAKTPTAPTAQKVTVPPSPVTHEANQARYTPVKESPRTVAVAPVQPIVVPNWNQQIIVPDTKKIIKTSLRQDISTPPPAVLNQVARTRDCTTIVDQVIPTATVERKQLILAFIDIESSCNPNAVSPKDARGILQVLPGTWRQMGCGRMNDPYEQVRCGIKYLNYLAEDHNNHSIQDLAMSYNGGPGHKGGRDVRKYAQDVTKRFRERMSMIRAQRKEMHEQVAPKQDREDDAVDPSNKA